MTLKRNGSTAELIDLNFSTYNCSYIIMYVESTCEYLHYFRMLVESATTEITIAIENSQSLKLCQTRQCYGSIE